METKFLLVDEASEIVKHPSTEIIATYPNGEVLVRTAAPMAESARAIAAPQGLNLGVPVGELQRAGGGLPADADSPFLAYVVLAGPTLGDWLEQLREAGVEPVRFQPESAYLSRGTAVAFDRAMELPFVVQIEPLTRALKPRARIPEAGAEDVWLVIQADADLDAVIARLVAIPGVDITGKESIVGGVARVPAVLTDAAQSPVLEVALVLAIEKREPILLEDERAGLILAGEYDHMKRPSGDYLDWLQSHGLSGRGTTIGIVDNGVDETHEAFSTRITVRDPGREWHGTFVAGHAAGRYLDERDRDGFVYGLGMAPSAELISQDNQRNADDLCRETATTSGPSGDAGTIQNNSWGAGTHSPMDYRSMEAAYDALVRNATPADGTARPLTICFSAGNSGTSGLTRPKAAKNVLVTGNSENYRPADGGSESDNIDHLYTGDHASSHGNCGDGRVRPHVIAPGEWTSSANFDSHPGQAEYISDKLTWGGGTSGASPKTAGACALLTQWWRDRNGGRTPSPALLRAMVVNGAEDTGAGGPVPNSQQGWGRLNLANVLSDHVHHGYVDQSSVLRHRGETRTWRLRVSDPSMPVRVTLAWTDPPGPLNSGTASVAAVVNRLALRVRTAGRSYEGNNFVNGFSVDGELPDATRAGWDNLQNIFIAPGEAQSPFTVEVAALNVTTDCMDGTAATPRQDFALVVTNGYVDQGFAPSELFMVIDDTSPGAGSGIDDVVTDDDDDDDLFDARPTLRRGDRGESVRELQELLDQAGFLTGRVDGNFGFGTQANVKSFQRAQGLGADGVVGPATWAALDAATGGASGGGSSGGGTSGGGTSGGGTSGDTRPVLRNGSRGDDVVDLQEMLRDLGFLSGRADGIFGNGTARAVQAFQRSVGLSADGVVGASTWAALETASSGRSGGTSGGGTSGGGTSGGGSAGGTTGGTRPVLRNGSRGDDVLDLQEMLKDRGFLSGRADGIFGNGTARAVQAFQRSVGLSADGVVGASTWAALESGSGGGTSGGDSGGSVPGGSASGGSTAPDVSDRPTLRHGSRGDDVVDLQTMLKDRGFLTGRADGIFGNGTARAVRAFQRSQGLTADGIVGGSTWAALMSEAPRRAEAPRGGGAADDLRAAAETALRAAPGQNALRTGAMAEDGRELTFSEKLRQLARQLDAAADSGTHQPAIVVCGGNTRADQDDLKILRRLATQAGLYLIGTDEVVLQALVQEMHLRHGVHLRLATPEDLDRAVMSAAAEAAGSRALHLEEVAAEDMPPEAAHAVRFSLTPEDSKALVRFEGATRPTLLIVAPDGSRHRPPPYGSLAGVRVSATASGLLVEMDRTEGAPWAGHWTVQAESDRPGSIIRALGFAGPGPVLRTAHRLDDDETCALIVRGEDGATVERVSCTCIGQSHGIAQESARPLEVAARPKRIGNAVRSEAEGTVSVGALEVRVDCPVAEREPVFTAHRLVVHGRTADGAAFARVLHHTVLQLVPRRIWRQRRRMAQRQVAARIVDAPQNRGGQVMSVVLHTREGGRIEAGVDAAVQKALAGPLDGWWRIALKGGVVVAAERLGETVVEEARV